MVEMLVSPGRRSIFRWMPPYLCPGPARTFGNLTLHGELRDAKAGDPRPLMLNYSGRAVIDIVKKQLYLQDVTEKGDALPREVNDQVDFANTRHYVLNGSSLTLTVNGADGAPTAASAWKKRPPSP